MQVKIDQQHLWRNVDYNKAAAFLKEKKRKERKKEIWFTVRHLEWK